MRFKSSGCLGFLMRGGAPSDFLLPDVEELVFADVVGLVFFAVEDLAVADFASACPALFPAREVLLTSEAGTATALIASSGAEDLRALDDDFVFDFFPARTMTGSIVA